MQYARDLEEIASAEAQGAISSQLAAKARETAAQRLAAASAATDQYSSALARNATTTQQGVMVGYQLQDVLVTSQMGFQSALQIGLQQGTQLASQFQMMKSGGSVLSGLAAGFTSLVSPLSLITVGATIAAAAILKFFFSSTEETKKFSDALSDTNSRISAMNSAAKTARAGIGDMVDGYGRLNEELDKHLDRLVKVEKFRAMNSNRDMVQSIQDSIPDGWFNKSAVKSLQMAGHGLLRVGKIGSVDL